MAYNQGVYTPKNSGKYIGKNVPKYRSGWELQFMRMCDSHPNVLAWASESHSIPYVHPITGQKKSYVPDFFMIYMDKNGKKHAEIVEIKPTSHTLGNAKGQYDTAQAVINHAKWSYAQQWCKTKGLGWRIITENEMFNRPQKPRPQRKPKVRKR